MCWGPRARPVPAPFVLPFGCSPSPPGVRFGCPVPSKVPLLSLPSSYIYQKRWVKLDADYLRYFDSEKVRGEVSGGGHRAPHGIPLGVLVARRCQGTTSPAHHGSEVPQTPARGRSRPISEAVVVTVPLSPHPVSPPQDAYSKRFIPVSSISRVASVGDQKFEVVTTNRNFVFRAESDGERWGDTSPDPILGLLPSSWQPPGPSDEPPQPQP